MSTRWRVRISGAEAHGACAAALKSRPASVVIAAQGQIERQPVYGADWTVPSSSQKPLGHEIVAGCRVPGFGVSLTQGPWP